MLKNSTKFILSVFLSFQVGVAPLTSYASNQQTRQSEPIKKLSEADLTSDIDPIWDTFVKSKATSDFTLIFSASDPAIDKDPYFMRSQRWNRQQKQSRANSLNYKKTDQSLEIQLPNSDQSLVLNLPLTPIQATENYIFLSLNTSSNIFKYAAGESNIAGEGIFFINRADLEKQAQNGNPAPIFFFPLAGQGWTGELHSVLIPQANIIALSNKTDSIAIELGDIDTAMKAQQINLMMAAALSAKNRHHVTKDMLPAPGMTAAFGLFFTGIDLQMPEKSFWTNGNSVSSLKNKAPSLISKKIASIFKLVFGKAEASAALPPELIARLVYVGSVLTGMLAASIVIKYAHPGMRKKIKDLRSSQEQIKNPLKLASREIKETFDIFAAMTSTASQVAVISFTNALEIFLDRFAPTVAAADHTLIRRFLNNTFFFSRKSLQNAPVNSRTFVLGALVMGSVDTSMVAVQYQVAVPWIADAASPHVGEDMQNRINHTFDPHNPNTQQIAIQDVVRNAVAYVQSGASSYSMDARAQVIELATKEVETEMKARGIDPNSPQVQSEKQRKIEEKINITMKQKGLPDQSQFLFDATTIYSAIPKALGYKAPEDIQFAQSFILERRLGLSKNAIDKAIQVATQWVKNDSSNAAREALAVLEETSKSINLFKNAMTNGKDGLAAARKMRQQLTILSYEGSVEYAVKYIPEIWLENTSPAGAQAASLIFRQALYSYISSEGDELFFADKNNIEKFGEVARQTAMSELKNSHPDINTNNLNAELKFELKLRTQILINNLARGEAIKEKAKEFKPEKLDWMAKRKQDRAMKEMETQLTAFLNTEAGLKVSDDDLNQLKQKLFRNALAKQVGLHIEDSEVAAAQNRTDYVAMLASVEKNATELAKSEIENNPNMSQYLKGLSLPEKEKMKLFIYANHFLQAYKEATTDLELVKPTDPAQPGRFQKLRQTEIVRNSVFLTRTLRALESFGNDQAMALGWGAALSRNIPLASDLFGSHKRMLKTGLTYLTLTYAWNYFAWQIHLPYSSWVLFTATVGATIITPSMWLNRLFRLNGLKAMDSVMSKIAYSLPYAWVTFAGMFPILLYSGDVSVLFSDYVRTPVLSVLEHIQMKDWIIGALGLGIIAQSKHQKKTELKGDSSDINRVINPKENNLSKTGTGTTGLIMCREILI